MFTWIVAQYRRLEAAIAREADAVERTAELRETFNAAMEDALANRGIAAPAKESPKINGHDSQPVNRIASTNGKKVVAK